MMLWFFLSPLLLVGSGALLLMLAEAFAKPGRREGFALGTAVVFAAGLMASVGCWLHGLDGAPEATSLSPWLVVDRFTLFFDGLFCLGGLLAALIAGGYLREHRMERGEFYMLLMFSTLGAMMIAGAGDILTVFLGLETMSIGAYALTAFRRTSPRSAEGAIKYFLLGAFGAAVLLFGFALLYGATGHTDLKGIGASLSTMTSGVSSSRGVQPGLVWVALPFVLVGLLFKVSAAPFHMWTPDAYEGAPTAATTYMAAVVKAGAFAMLLRVLFGVFGHATFMSWASGWPPALALIAVVTMTVANLVASQQESVKRMLAYSSIAHAGYLLVGVVTAGHGKAQAASTVLFYLVTYTVSTAGAFGALVLCGRRGAEAVTYEDLSGIGRRHPPAALALSLFLVSLAGFPSTAGFFGKWFIFRNAIDSGFYILTIVVFFNSVVAAYYYLRVMVFMYMREPAAGAPIATPMRSGFVTAALLISAVFVLFLGLMPSSTLDVAIDAAAVFGG